jgi:hypothetical protein
MEGVWFEKDPLGGAVRIFSLFSAPPETHGEPRHCGHFEQDQKSSSLLLSVLPARHIVRVHSTAFLKSVLK